MIVEFVANGPVNEVMGLLDDELLPLRTPLIMRMLIGLTMAFMYIGNKIGL